MKNSDIRLSHYTRRELRDGKFYSDDDLRVSIWKFVALFIFFSSTLHNPINDGRRNFSSFLYHNEVLLLFTLADSTQTLSSNWTKYEIRKVNFLPPRIWNIYCRIFHEGRHHRQLHSNSFILQIVVMCVMRRRWFWDENDRNDISFRMKNESFKNRFFFFESIEVDERLFSAPLQSSSSNGSRMMTMFRVGGDVEKKN